MSAPNDSWKSALEHIWGQYRVWAATSRAYKAKLSRWRRVVLALGVAGGVVGVLSSQQWLWEGLRPELPKALGVISAALLALAAYFSKEILSPDDEGRWIRARAAAEAFKREAYLLRARVPPYDGHVIPLTRADEIAEAVEGLEYEVLTPEQKRGRMPAAPLTVADYIRERVDEQIEKFYEPKAVENRAVVRKIRTVTMALGALATAFGLLGAWWIGVPAFVAVITTVTTALAAYLYAGRYQYLAVSYLATAQKLGGLRAGWRVSGKSDADAAERNQFIRDCEAVFAAENGAWMAEWTKPAGKTQPPAGDAGAGA